MRTRMYGGVRGRKTKVGGKPTFVFLLLDYGLHRADATINRFRSKRLADGRFESIFCQIVALLHEEGLISLDVHIYADVYAYVHTEIPCPSKSDIQI